MKVKVLAALLALSFLTALILPAVAHAESLVLTPTSGTVGSEVNIPAFCQYGEGEYFLYWGDSNQLIQQGTMSKSSCQPLTFKVPQSPRGKQLVTLKMGSKTFQKEFTVKGTISLGVKKGMVGSEVAVQGDGFDARETGIKIIFNSNEVASGIEANAGGSWLYTLKIPASSKGNHSVSASGATTPSTEIKEQIFTVTPSFSINPNSGWVGRVVTVSGAGFGGGE
ncbi:MAG: hypothetical protein WC169_12470, partial [Dehalococcoidia bacterium]